MAGTRTCKAKATLAPTNALFSMTYDNVAGQIFHFCYGNILVQYSITRRSYGNLFIFFGFVSINQ